MFKFGKWELLLLLIATIIAFSPIIKAGFVFYDDPEYVLENPYIKKFSIQNLAEIFKGKATILYVPLTTCSYYLDMFIFGEKAPGFHFINLLLHLINTVLLFKLLITFRLKKELIFSALIFFAVNPLNTESVCWITERKDLLYTFFLIISATYFLKYLDKRSLPFYTLSLILFILSCLSKPMAVTFPALILVYYYVTDQFKKINVLSLIPYFIISVIISVISFYCIHNNSTGKINITDYTLTDKLFLFTGEIGYYFTKEFLPVKLSLFHFFPKPGALYSKSMLFMFGLGLGVVFLFFGFRKHKLKVGLLLSWLILLLPILQIIPNTHSYVSERYFYLTIIFPVIFIGLSFPRLFQKRFLPVSVILIILFTSITFIQSKKWKDTETLFNYEIELDQQNQMAFNNLGYYYNNSGQFNRAKSNLEKAIRLDPSNGYYMNNFGWCLTGLGQPDSGIICFKKAIDLKNNFFEAHNNLGICYYTIGKENEALNEFKFAEKINNSHPEVLYNLGAYYLKNNNLPLAKQYLQNASNRGHKGAKNLLVKYKL